MNTKVDEGKLISGKEALIALANGENVEFEVPSQKEWRNIKSDSWDLDIILNNKFGHKFRLKPRTITINGIDIPAPFEPKEGEWFYFIKADSENGYSSRKLHDDTPKYLTLLGAWRTEEEIKQVVAALRQVFGGSHDN